MALNLFSSGSTFGEVTMTAGATITAGQPLYLNRSDGKVYPQAAFSPSRDWNTSEEEIYNNLGGLHTYQPAMAYSPERDMFMFVYARASTIKGIAATFDGTSTWTLGSETQIVNSTYRMCSTAFIPNSEYLVLNNGNYGAGTGYLKQTYHVADDKTVSAGVTYQGWTLLTINSTQNKGLFNVPTSYWGARTMMEWHDNAAQRSWGMFRFSPQYADTDEFIYANGNGLPYDATLVNVGNYFRCQHIWLPRSELLLSGMSSTTLGGAALAHDNASAGTMVACHSIATGLDLTAMDFSDVVSHPYREGSFLTVGYDATNGWYAGVYVTDGMYDINVEGGPLSGGSSLIRHDGRMLHLPSSRLLSEETSNDGYNGLTLTGPTGATAINEIVLQISEFDPNEVLLWCKDDTDNEIYILPLTIDWDAGTISEGTTVTITDVGSELAHNSIVQTDDKHAMVFYCTNDGDAGGYDMRCAYATFGTKTYRPCDYVGLATEAATADDDITVTLGSTTDIVINDQQSGLTVGSKYYLQNDGTLGTNVDTGVYVGIAVSATEILIQGGKSRHNRCPIPMVGGVGHVTYNGKYPDEN